MKKIHSKDILGTVAGVILVTLCFICLKVVMEKECPSSSALKQKLRDTEVSETQIEDTLSLVSLYKEIQQQEIAHPDIVWAQAILETGWLKKHTNNNLFGMKKPTKRPNLTLASSPKNYAHYKHWVDAVTDYKLWQKFCQVDKLSRDAYLDFLAEHYATDKQYVIKLKKILNNQSIL